MPHPQWPARTAADNAGLATRMHDAVRQALTEHAPWQWILPRLDATHLEDDVWRLPNGREVTVVGEGGFMSSLMFEGAKDLEWTAETVVVDLLFSGDADKAVCRLVEAVLDPGPGEDLGMEFPGRVRTLLKAAGIGLDDLAEFVRAQHPHVLSTEPADRLMATDVGPDVPEQSLRERTAGTAELSRLLGVLRGYQHVDDPGHVLIALAVAVTRDLDDEPCWLLFVAPPSSGKTETVRLLDDIAEARLNEVTAPGLLTWGKGKPPKATGILAMIPERALLTFGDLSSLLATSDRGGRDQVFGLLRRVYDGEASRDMAPPPGAPAGSRLVWTGRATVVAAVTGVIDAYTSHADALGPRWVYYRLDERSTTEKRAAARMARRGGLAEPRAEARALALGIVHAARKVAADVEVPETIAEHVEDAALVCCWGRAAVSRNGYGKREIDGIAMVEEPPRLIRQLLVLARGLLALRIDPETATALVRRVALDSMPATRRAVLQVLASGEMNLTTAKVAASARLERGVARRTLEELEVIGIVTGSRAGVEPHEHEQDRRPCTWSLTGEDGVLVAAVLREANRSRGRCAETWGPPTQPPKNRDTGEITGEEPPH